MSGFDHEQRRVGFSGECEAGPDVFARQVREVPEQVFFGHAGRQVVEHVGYRDAQATDAGLATTLSGLDRDPVEVRHRFTLRNAPPLVKREPAFAAAVDVDAAASEACVRCSLPRAAPVR